MPEESRNLTDADARAVADALWARAAIDLKMGVGAGVLHWLWRSMLKIGLWLALLGLAHSYGLVALNLHQQTPPHP